MKTPRYYMSLTHGISERLLNIKMIWTRRKKCYVLVILALLAIVTSMMVISSFMSEELDDTWDNVSETQDCLHDLVLTSGKSAKETFIGNVIQTDGKDTHKSKYIVYDCGSATWAFCGGWSDRMSGILSTFTISLLTKRRFLINMNRPCPLHEYLIPAQYEWRYNSSLLTGRTSSYQDITMARLEKFRAYLSGTRNINRYFKHDINFVQINWDFTEVFRKRQHIGCEIPWITKLHYADMYKQLYNFLFKPSPVLARALNDFNRTQRTRPKIACAHLRLGGNINMPFDAKRGKLPIGMLWNHFDNLDREEYDFFFASDTNSVKHLAKQRYPGNVIDTPGKITHIDQSFLNDKREGFMKQLLDFYTLVKCDILIITPSGFGMLAAYIREQDTGLYCWIGRDIRPCSRYTAHNIIPDEMLAPDA